MRELKSVPLSENSYAVVRFRLIGMSTTEVFDLNQVPPAFIARTTSVMILEELRKRRAEGLMK
jgi:hypothetical protein